MMKKRIIISLLLLLLLCGCNKKNDIDFNEDTLYVVNQMNSSSVMEKQYSSITITTSKDQKPETIEYFGKDLNYKIDYIDNSKNIAIYQDDVIYGVNQNNQNYETITGQEKENDWDLSRYLDFDSFKFDSVYRSDDLIIVKLLLSEDGLSAYKANNDLRDLEISQVERSLTLSAKNYSLISIDENIILNGKDSMEGKKIDVTYDEEVAEEVNELVRRHNNSASYDTLRLLINENTIYEIVRDYNVIATDEISVELGDNQTLDNIDHYDGLVVYHITDHGENIERNEDSIDPYDSSGFVLLTDYVPDAILEIRYYSTYNFVGNRIEGYEEPIALLTKEAALRLKEVADELREKGYRLKIFDAYRPTVAEDYFVAWCEDLSDQRMKEYFYPDLDKSLILPQGYLAHRTGHNRGSTLDLTLFDMATGKEVDMGYPFDYFGIESHPDYTEGISETQYNNRIILREAMMSHNFRPFEGEWWHFIMNDEPYPNTNFSFPVNKKVLKDYN